ncbi:MAG: YihY/virulence factor BrkB family protein [Bacteroidales bacterium]|nr:YihY/virulence factor BrkB family protein [Bacteroidales bacterium]
MKENLRQVLRLLKLAARKYRKDNPVQLAGTTAFFAVFAMAPLIIIIVSVAGLLLGQEQIQAKLFDEINSFLGNQSTEYIQSIVENFQNKRTNIIATIVGFVIFIFISTTFFTVLQKSLNDIWGIRAKPKHNFLKTLYDRLISFGLILSLGFIMLVSLIIDAALSLFQDFMHDRFPDFTILLIEAGNFILSFGIIWVIFAMIYRFLPDVHIKWRVTWIGALITTFLFIIGKALISFGIGSTNISSIYGAAGSLVVILLWVFYSSLIFFFGAEITQQYAEMYSHTIKPKDFAVRVEINEVSSE